MLTLKQAIKISDLKTEQEIRQAVESNAKESQINWSINIPSKKIASLS